MINKTTIENVRPEYVMENYEDWIYHDHRDDTDPEIYAFTKKVMVFNRTLKWLDEGLDGCILCYSEAGDLYLTGENQASRWFSDPDNYINENGGFTVFTKNTTKRRRDCIVLPAFQFHKGQHPQVELTVSDAADDWQFCIFIKGRSGPPIICSGWRKDGCTLTLDIAAELDKRGYGTLQFAELHFVMGTWSKSMEASSSVTFRLCLPGCPAVVSCLPVIRTLESTSDDGLPIAAIVSDGQGKRLCSDKIKMFALVDDRKEPLEEKGSIWKVSLKGLKSGNYRIELVTEGSTGIKGFAIVRITDGKFFSYKKDNNLLFYDNKVTGPLSGSYHGMSFFKNVGLDSEKMINGQNDWDSWDRTQLPGEHWHYWEAMTENELDEKFEYLEECGWNLLHLCQHFGVWKRLDAGGRIAPHGAEQLALYIRTAAKHNLAVLQALSHYAYGVYEQSVEGMAPTPPFSHYVDEGFMNEDWTNTNNHFTKLFHIYLSHFASMFKEETGLFSMTTSGEGDWVAGRERVNDTCSFVKSLDKNHLYIAEPILIMKKLPREYYDGWRQELFGSRVYWAGDENYPEYDLGLEFKMMQLGPVFMGEGSWPYPPAYGRFTKEETYKDCESWCGTLQYRVRVRDSIYLGLVHKLPVILTWDEQISEDERIVFNEVRKLVNWDQSFMKPKVDVIVDDTNFEGEGRKNLIEYEKAFMSMPLAHRYIEYDSAELKDSEIVFDARKPFRTPFFKHDGGTLPDSLKEYMPLKISEGYNSSCLWSEDKQTLLAYVYNTTNHIELPPHPLGGKYHRIPQPTGLKVALQNFPDRKLDYRIYDLNDKILIKQGVLVKGLDVDFGVTVKDYFVVVIP